MRAVLLCVVAAACSKSPPAPSMVDKVARAAYPLGQPCCDAATHTEVPLPAGGKPTSRVWRPNTITNIELCGVSVRPVEPVLTAYQGALAQVGFELEPAPSEARNGFAPDLGQVFATCTDVIGPPRKQVKNDEGEIAGYASDATMITLVIGEGGRRRVVLQDAKLVGRMEREAAGK